MEEFPNYCNDVEYYEWAKVDGRVKKTVKSVDIEKAIEFQHVKSKICVINGAKDFAEYASKIINGISCL